jgi:aquaporin Z
MKKYFTEFIGTFFLVLAVGMASTMGAMAPVAIGATLMVMIFAGGHISGGHYNPAVTLAVLIRGRVTLGDALSYIGSQLAGALIASLVSGWLLGNPENTPMNLDETAMQALVAELLGTFALAYVVLNVATAKANAGNSFYGLAIGFTVTAMAYTYGGFSGGAFNPAVAIGQSLSHAFAWSNIWIYFVGCFGGGALAALVFKTNNKDDK